MNLKRTRLWMIFVFISLFLLVSVVKSNDDGDFDDEEDLEDDAVVTTEDDSPGSSEEDIPYTSPTPSGSAYFAEHFDDPASFKRRWILSEAKKEDTDEDIAKYDGKWELESPQKEVLKGDLGLVLKSKAKHAAISARLDRPFVFSTKPLVVQYEVTLQEGQECGGAYIKLLSQGKHANDLRLFHDKTPYTIMFGPDKCGNDHKMHFIFRHKNPLNGSYSEKHCKKPKERIEEPFKDKLPHLYTLIIHPDNTFSINLDQKPIKRGSLLEDFNPPVNPPAEIDDPEDRRPEDWDEREKIPDPDAVKPEEWDEDAPSTIPDPDAKKPDDWLEDEPEMIPDPNAEKPDDWDSDMDGEWEAPLITNPSCEKVSGCGKWKPPMITNSKYKGKWRAPYIDNPNYKGKWKPRRIPNPDFFEDKHPFLMTDIAAIGIELWSMSDNILFDNIIITDDPQVAINWASNTFDLKRRKFDKDGDTNWEKVMKSMNYKPGWWTLYFIYCFIPVAAYMWYIRCRVAEDKDADHHKKTDAMSPDDEELEEDKEDDGAEGEKSNDREDSSPPPVPKRLTKRDLEAKPEEIQDSETEEIQDSDAEGDAEVENAGAGDAVAGRSSPRKRNVRKEE